MQAMLGVYGHAARRSGRTTSLLNSLKDGDRVVAPTGQQAEYLRRLIHERGLKVEVITVDPAQPQRLFDRPRSEGRTLFEHTWVEQFYVHDLERAAQDIDEFQKRMSGTDEPTKWTHVTWREE